MSSSALELYGKAKANWRSLLLALFLLTSTIALFGGPSFAEPVNTGTNLQYGLQLEGGAQVQAPFVGMTAENVEYDEREPSELAELEREIADELDVEERAVQTRPEEGALEVYSKEYSEDEIAGAIQAAGKDVEADQVRPGVTEPTRETSVTVIETKIDESTELSGGRVTTVSTPGGEHFLQVEVPGANRTQVVNLLEERGVVEVDAIYPSAEGNETTYEREHLFTQEDLAGPPGTIDQTETGVWYVPVILDADSAADFARTMNERGFTDPTIGQGQCHWPPEEQEMPDDPGYCLVTYQDDEKVYAAGMGGTLGDNIRDEGEEWGGSFQMETTERDDARDLRLALQAGALPTDIDVDEGTSRFIGPSQAEQFRSLSMVTGIFAAIAVGGMVYLRYRSLKVAVPLTLTALAEVYILLAFASAMRIPLDLAHIAGFIAVIGTGVDDLVIIADEVQHHGEVKTRRVFQSRFRKAFWVIGVAAATTIIAMSPLMVMSLGDLSGFAIVTIIGVLIGVLVTRPAYGDILRRLMTDHK